MGGPREHYTIDRERQMLHVTYMWNLKHNWNLKHTYICMYALVAQSCPTLCNPIDYSPPNSFIHGILQAKILE